MAAHEEGRESRGLGLWGTMASSTGRAAVSEVSAFYGQITVWCVRGRSRSTQSGAASRLGTKWTVICMMTEVSTAPKGTREPWREVQGVGVGEQRRDMRSKDTKAEGGVCGLSHPLWACCGSGRQPGHL